MGGIPLAIKLIDSSLLEVRIIKSGCTPRRTYYPVDYSVALGCPADFVFPITWSG